LSKRIIVFIDSGDTIIDEGTEIRDENDIVQSADVIEGADQLLRTLMADGYRVAMVADGYAQSFYNMYMGLGLLDCFEHLIFSSDVGEHKPHPKMFETALEKMGLTHEDCKKIVMVGNNLERDIAGANGMGMTSVLLDWSPRYRMTSTRDIEIPDYIIHTPLELLKLLQDMERRDGSV